MTHECPECGSDAYKRNGYTRHGKQNHRCLDCGRQFSFEVRELIQRDNLASFYDHKEDAYIEDEYSRIIIE